MIRSLKKLPKVEVVDPQALTTLRMDLLFNGYCPIKAHDKRPLYKGWNTVDLTPDLIKSWIAPRAMVSLWTATGLRVEGGLLTIDLDIPNHELARDFRRALLKLAPQVAGALERGRSDGSAKVMLFLRRSGEPFIVRSHKWSHEESALEYMVEIFGSERTLDGAVQRQVGAFGPHTVEENGTVAVSYAWKGPTPAEVPLLDLPTIDEATAMAIVVAFDELAEQAGFKQVPGYQRGKLEHRQVYDLDDQQFEGPEFGPVDLAGLAEVYWQNDTVGVETRCSGSFTGQGGTRNDRCHVGWSGSRTDGHITVHDYATEITHRPSSFAPPAPEEIGALLEEIETIRGEEPEPEEPDERQTRWNAAVRIIANDHMSEDSFAQALLRYYDKRFRYDPFAGRWYRFDGTIWAEEHIVAIEEVVGLFCRAFGAILPRTDAGNTARRRIGAYRFKNAVERTMRSVFAYRDGFDLDPYLAAGGEMVIELKNGITRPGRPEDSISKRWLCAPADEEACPCWKRFLDEVTLSDVELQLLLQQWFGLSLAGDPSHQKLMFLYGAEGNNGKNTLVDTWCKIVGDYGYTANIKVFMASRFEGHPTDMWAFKGKRLIVASEVGEEAVWDEIRFKSFTGDSVITARAMRQDFETFARTWTITIIGNHQPKLRNPDGAMKRRIRMVPFEHVVPAEKIDPDLMGKLLVEAPGILRWGINGLIDARSRGLAEPERVRVETAEYFTGEDAMQAFAVGLFEADDTCEAAHTDVHRRWKSFAEARRVPPGNERSSAMRLRKIFPDLKSARRERGIVWVGVKMKALVYGWES